MPRKKPTNSAYQRKIDAARSSARAAQYNRQLDLLPVPKQRALKLGRSVPDNPLRHAAEYLKYTRKRQPLETSFRKEQPYYEYLDDYHWTRCERRRLEMKKRKEVLFASGKAGKRGAKYPGRKPPRTLKCK
jgi:hypothetical protein